MRTSADISISRLGMSPLTWVIAVNVMNFSPFRHLGSGRKLGTKLPNYRGR